MAVSFVLRNKRGETMERVTKEGAEFCLVNKVTAKSFLYFEKIKLIMYISKIFYFRLILIF